ncbi:hypothetical protein STRIP9103_09346 [Streptomyces ipomoeae 91-03]|uniref:Aldehyde dehydrogenase domain-containing protein n=1 Tax=Streptomyces ipomoeae 91-03 TaxID=698759 RepID=L1KJ29_9ACTN|nr:hypothetical protein STRIP9103_09346 [Streptomyces ipomoeae 91-03]
MGTPPSSTWTTGRPDDVKIEPAIDALMVAKTHNGGQACTAANRVLVARPVVERLTELSVPGDRPAGTLTVIRSVTSPRAAGLLGQLSDTRCVPDNYPLGKVDRRDIDLSLLTPARALPHAARP